ncbi:hypothetical protein TWF694_006036 [Orbilia ellipsospora]|uniref:ADF-H domain-containing protein n=1 Tax=Orbilia ellipsospora TaxID=2528407 RepID=A0AAV9WX38_9PEZI
MDLEAKLTPELEEFWTLTREAREENGGVQHQYVLFKLDGSNQEDLVPVNSGIGLPGDSFKDFIEHLTRFAYPKYGVYNFNAAARISNPIGPVLFIWAPDTISYMTYLTRANAVRREYGSIEKQIDVTDRKESTYDDIVKELGLQFTE